MDRYKMLIDGESVDALGGKTMQVIDPGTGELWGNFPQTYSMVGVINGAMRLSRPWDDVV